MTITVVCRNLTSTVRTVQTVIVPYRTTRQAWVQYAAWVQRDRCRAGEISLRVQPNHFCTTSLQEVVCDKWAEHTHNSGRSYTCMPRIPCITECWLWYHLNHYQQSFSSNGFLLGGAECRCQLVNQRQLPDFFPLIKLQLVWAEWGRYILGIYSVYRTALLVLRGLLFARCQNN